MKGTVVVAGGGVSGMLAALMVKRARPGTRVLLVEREAELGGLYRSFHYDGATFDCGTHLIYDTPSEEVNATVQGLLPDNEWVILEGNRKDVAGVFYHQKLQTHSAYIDLRGHTPDLQKKAIGDLVWALGNNPDTPPAENNADAFLKWRFGSTIAIEFLQPVLQQLYGHPLNELTTFSSRLTAMDRVILFDQPTMSDLMKSDLVRSRVAFPDQLNLPNIRTHRQRALYPKKGGMYRFVLAITAALKNAGVEIFAGHQITEIERTDNRIEKIVIQSQNKTETVTANLQLIWACGLPGLAPRFKINLSMDNVDKRASGTLVHLLFKKQPSIKDIYYFYVYDPGFSTFRVTNYSSYCPELSQKGYPLTVEIWPRSNEKKTAEDWTHKALAELKQFGVIDSADTPILARAETLKEGLPLPTVKNRNWLRNLRNELRSLSLQNLTLIGSGAEEDLFFLNDILLDLHNKITRLG